MRVEKGLTPLLDLQQESPCTLYPGSCDAGGLEEGVACGWE